MSARGPTPLRSPPGAIWYVVAVTVLAAGVAAAVLLVREAVASVDADALQRVVVPGARELELTAGRHTIFYEHRSVVGGRVFATGPFPDGLEVRVETVPSGQEVPLTAPLGTAEYEFPSRAGVSILAFDVERAGTYRLAASYVPGRSGPEVVLGVGRLAVVRTILGVAAAFAAFGLAFTVALVIGTVTFVRRRSPL